MKKNLRFVTPPGENTAVVNWGLLCLRRSTLLLLLIGVDTSMSPHRRGQPHSQIPTLNGFHSSNRTDFTIIASLENNDLLFIKMKWWCFYGVFVLRFWMLRLKLLLSFLDFALMQSIQTTRKTSDRYMVIKTAKTTEVYLMFHNINKRWLDTRF